MKEITLRSGKYLMVEVPKGFYGYSIVGDLVKVSDRVGDYITIKIPPGNWIPVGLASELTEEQWKGIVEQDKRKISDGVTSRIVSGYKDYERDGSSSIFTVNNTATESGHSLLSSHGMKPERTLMLRLIPSGLAIDSTKVK